MISKENRGFKLQETFSIHAKMKTIVITPKPNEVKKSEKTDRNLVVLILRAIYGIQSKNTFTTIRGLWAASNDFTDVWMGYRAFGNVFVDWPHRWKIHHRYCIIRGKLLKSHRFINLYSRMLLDSTRRFRMVGIKTFTSLYKVLFQFSLFSIHYNKIFDWLRIA